MYKKSYKNLYGQSDTTGGPYFRRKRKRIRTDSSSSSSSASSSASSSSPEPERNLNSDNDDDEGKRSKVFESSRDVSASEDGSASEDERIGRTRIRKRSSDTSSDESDVVQEGSKL